MFFGFVIIIIGLVFLMQNLGLLGQEVWNIVWPAIIILFGVSLIIRKK